MKAMGLGLVVALMMATSTAADAETIGIQFIGLSSTSFADIDYVAASLAGVKGSSEASALPHEFNRGNPYGAASRLVTQYIGRGGNSLRITFYLKWFPHDAIGNGDAAQFWGAWNAAKPNTTQRAIKDNYLARVNAMMGWIASARSVGGSKVRYTCVPCLEDVCESQSAYSKLVAAIEGRRTAYGAGAVAIRRSCLPQYATFRGGAGSLEIHGSWSQAKPYLRSGDVWSNDGTEVAPAAFAKDAALARAAGVSSLFWRISYNGQPRNRDNWPQRTVNPFSGAGWASEQAALKTVLKGR